MNDESHMPSNAAGGHGASVEPVLVAKGISKFFPGVIALDNVDFEIRPGEVNALLGENGAGKSTLIKIMSGFYTPDRGEIRVNGKRLEADPAAAHRAGVATIHQEAHLVPSMTVAENIMLGHWPTSRFGVISKKEQTQRVLGVLARVAPELSPSTPARRLSPAEGQLVEIARALSENSRVLIMDEPTTSLSTPRDRPALRDCRRFEVQGPWHRVRIPLARRGVPDCRPHHCPA